MPPIMSEWRATHALFRGDMTFNFQLSKATYLYDYGATSQP